MPINAFGGGPGSGKTYGVVEHVLLPAIAKGRFVITNIEGLDVHAIYEYVVENFYKGKIICVGHIRTCGRDAPSSDDFFPGAAQLDTACSLPAPDAPKVCGGDLVVIDEATRYWAQGTKVLPSHAYFFREHRHFANELGHTCDLVVIDPDLSMLTRALKGKIELASVTHKPKAVGLNRYVVRIYRGANTAKKPQSIEGPYEFKAKIYSLYKSYAHEKAKEQTIDKRQNTLFSKRNLTFMAFIVALLILCIYGLYWAYQRKMKTLRPEDDPEQVRGAQMLVPVRAAGASSATNAGVGSGPKSDALRVVGEVVIRGERWIVVSDSAGIVRFENPAAFVGQGVLVVGTVEGSRVTTWTGMQAKSQSIVGSGK